MIIYDGKSDVGYEREEQEDSITVTELGEKTFLFLIADGAGKLPSGLSPSEIACSEVSQSIQRQFEMNDEYVIDNAECVLKEALELANRVLGAFKKADETHYAGFSTSMTACLIHDNNFTFAHCGDTRLYLIRKNKQSIPTIRQLTYDHTKAYKLFMEGKLDVNQYHTHPDRLVITSGIGFLADPEIQSLSSRIKPDDIIVMTTDGIHYAIREEAIMELVLKSSNTSNAVDALITASKEMKYQDNMSAMVLFTIPD